MVTNIAIDGTSGSGKSSVASKLADILNYYHLNTGQLYRAYALKCIQMGILEPTLEDVLKIVETTSVEVVFKDKKQITLLDGNDVTNILNDNKISAIASLISPYQELRNKVVSVQRELASKYNIIIEGRDIGTKIIPNAKYKFFITASVEARAERRFKQLKEMGKNVTYDEILQGLKERDDKDINRKHSPLVMAKDSILIDTSNLTFEQVVDLVLSHISKSDYKCDCKDCCK